MLKSVQRNEGWVTALFLVGMMLTAGWMLAVTDWTEALGAVVWTGIGGLAAGLLLGWSVFRPETAHLYSTVYGLTWTGFLLGSSLPVALTWGERVRELVVRFLHWVIQVVNGERGQDALVFVLLASLLFWILGYSAAWHTYRRLRPWRAVAPLSLLVVMITYYYTGPEPMERYLGLYALLFMLYLARAHGCEQERIWRRERIGYAPDVRATLMRASVLVTLVVLLVSWAVPVADAAPGASVVWRRVTRPWQTIQEEWQRVFSTLHGSPTTSLLEPFGPTLALGGLREESETLLLDVAAPVDVHTYWRAAVYAEYTGAFWRAEEGERMALLPGRVVPGLADDSSRRPITQTVTNYLPGRQLLVGASEIVIVDRDAEAVIEASVDAPVAYVRLSSLLPLAAGEQYEVRSLVSEASVASLREAGGSSPSLISQRYLQLPTGLPDRVRILAETLTADALNDYDRAVAIERYLRETLVYDLNPPSLPDGRDYVDFLLFESQRDSCNGYASAMVVLARSVGIPARVAVGYTEGEYDIERGVFRVRERNAHAWPEMYFPGYGWIAFEPTVSQAPFVRLDQREVPELMEERVPRGAGKEDLGAPEDTSDNLWGDASGERLGPSPSAPGRSIPLWLAVVLAGLVVFVGVGWWVLENLGLRHLSAVDLAYARLLRMGTWLGCPSSPADTPHEWARVACIAAPGARASIDEIVDLYTRAHFAGRSTSYVEAQMAWQRARPILWRSWFRRLLSWPQRWHG